MTSHEFRTPLATILSSAELLEHYGAQMPPEEKQELHQSIRAGVERMTRMLDNVLVIGRAEAQMLEFKPALTDLAAFCERLAGEMRLAAGVQPHARLHLRRRARSASTWTSGCCATCWST